jgi:hypothetical protein
MLRALPALLLAAALVAACGTSKTQSPAQSAPGTRVSVTADWGATPIATGRGNIGTVIAATGGVAQLTTGYGGRYVTAIDGQAGDGTRDWIFWINGIESPVGGADVEVAAGDRVWWDLHRWNGRVNVPAVVAEWPLPRRRPHCHRPHQRATPPGRRGDGRTRPRDAGLRYEDGAGAET